MAGLLALMLLTDARRPARTGPDGSLVPLAEQDRSRWDAAAIAEGSTLITEALASAPDRPYQLQAAIAAVHDEAGRAEDTDWRQILGLYDLLDRLAPGPMVTLNRIVAVAMVHGPEAGLGQLAAAEAIRGWPGTTGSTPSAPTCSSWPATRRRRAPATSWPRAAPSASPSGATWPPAPPPGAASL